MIHLRITAEAVTDLLTPGVVYPNALVEGLPPGCALTDISFEDDMVLYTFDDGKPELSIAKIKYIATMPPE